MSFGNLAVKKSIGLILITQQFRENVATFSMTLFGAKLSETLQFRASVPPVAVIPRSFCVQSMTVVSQKNISHHGKLCNQGVKCLLHVVNRCSIQANLIDAGSRRRSCVANTNQDYAQSLYKYICNRYVGTQTLYLNI